MAKAPRKPTLLKYPKKPKASSSTTVLDRYLQKVKAIDIENRDRMSRYERDIREWENDKKRHASLVKAISGIGTAKDGVKKRKKPTRRKSTAKKATSRKRAASRKKSTTRRKTTARRRR